MAKRKRYAKTPTAQCPICKHSCYIVADRDGFDRAYAHTWDKKWCPGVGMRTDLSQIGKANG